MSRRTPPLRHCCRGAAAAALAMALAGCAVGPDFTRPAPPQGARYTPGPLPRTTASAPGPAGTAQDFDVRRGIPAQWWQLFRSPELNALITRAFAANPDVAAAQAALRQAQEQVYAQRGFFFPTVQVGYLPSRIMLSGNTVGGNAPGVQGNGSALVAFQGIPASQGGRPPYNEPITYNWHSAQLTVGFVPDVFGANRRQVESLQAQADAQRFDLQAAYITLATNVVAAAIQEAALRAQVAVVDRIVVLNRDSLATVRRQFRYGYAGAGDVAAQETALAQAQLLLPPLRTQLAQTRDLLRTLAGGDPGHELPQTFTLAALHLPQHLPLSLPSQLVEQRPDVRAAEARLHAATAAVGVAEAGLLPQFSLTAATGGEATRISEMFWGSGQFFTLVGSIGQTLFAGGTLLHHKRAADAALVQAAAQYRGTVLAALRDVADTLHTLYGDAETLRVAVRAEGAARDALDITRRQQRLGYVGYLAVLQAEQAYRQAEIALVQARASRLGDTAALFQALGGGWWNAVPTRTSIQAAPSTDRAGGHR